jgi:hypothetical protein
MDPTKVDLSTLSLGSITFGKNVINLPQRTNSYNTTFKINSSLAVRIQGSLDPDTGLVKWTFTSIDPSTSLPPSDPTVGFLPPDTDGVKGQGSVLFTVMPKSGLPTDTQITNQAIVVFDANAPINTPTWMNTIHVDPPQSHVPALPAQEAQVTFNVTWSSTDKGSGVASYTVYLSDNGSPFIVWQNAVTATSASFTGQPGHQYSFYSIAFDNVGNTEPSKSSGDTSTTISPTAVTGAGPVVAAIVNAASFQPGAFAGGAIVTIFGSNRC